MVDRLLLFDKGRLVADGPRDKVIAMLHGKAGRPDRRKPPLRCRPVKRRCSQSDFAFANDIRAAAELRTPRTSRMLLFCDARAARGRVLVWAHFAVLDEVKRGNGTVVPSRQIQVVQSLEGGIVGESCPGRRRSCSRASR